MRYMLRVTSLTSLLLAVLSGALLFWVSQQVQQVEREHRQLQAALSQEEESIRVLKAEWDYLNRPERLEELAQKYLNMTPVSADSLIQSISAIPEPEAPSMAPEEAPLEISTASGPRVQKPSVSLPPPVLSEKEPSQEEQFNAILEDPGATGQ